MNLVDRKSDVRKNTFDVPVLFLVFNRLEQTKQVFAKIKEIRPSKFYVASDGPRNDRERVVTDDVRAYVLTNIDWECEIRTLFRETNLGCGKAVSSSISWFFDNVEEGIILEDDCLPDSSFFQFAGEILAKYRHDDRIFHIGGHCIQLGRKRGTADYYFSHKISVWGWATWKRAWSRYEFDFEFDQNVIDNIFPRETRENRHWTETFINFRSRNIDTWDYQWTYTCFKHKGKAIVPNKNLVFNIGFDNAATHTASMPYFYDYLTLEQIKFPLVHPDKLEVDRKADQFEFNMEYPSVIIRAWRFVKMRTKRMFGLQRG